MCSHTCKSVRGCGMFENLNMCNEHGEEGPGWEKKSWGALANVRNAQGVNPLQACCACGGGSVASALEVGEDEVEGWVVRSMEAELVQGKIDQLRKVVTVSNTAQRVYTPEQWKVMHAKLSAWTDNVRSMLGMLLAARQRAADAAAAHAAASST